MRSAQLVLAGFALVAAAAAVAADTNLLPNGDFSQQNQITGWNCLGGSWSSEDANSIAGSGSLWLQNAGPAAASCTSSCFAVRPGAAYTLGGQSRLLLGSPVLTFACAESATTQCNSFSYDLHGPAMSIANTWNDPPASVSGVLASGTLSLNCKITFGSVDLGTVSGRFDNLFFTTDVIFADDFESP